MFGLPKWAVSAIAAAVILVAALWGVSCYGKSKYDEGRRGAEIAHTDSVRKAMTHAIDSVSQTLTPKLDSLLGERDSLEKETRKTRIEAASNLSRARRAEILLHQMPESILAVTPPTVRALIDTLSATVDSLGHSVQKLATRTVELEKEKNDALDAAERWKKLQAETRAALDTAGREIVQLQRQKSPPRFGFKTGVAVGAGGMLAVAALVAHFVR